MAERKGGLPRVFGGMLAATGFGGAVCLVYVAAFRQVGRMPRFAGNLIVLSAYPNLLLIPIGMGLVAAFIWRPLRLSIAECLGLSAMTVLFMLLAGAAIFGEGAVCLLIVSPIFLIAMFCGTLLGRVLFRRDDRNVRLTIVPLLVVAIFAEGRVARERENVVEDQIVIAADAAEVWKHVVAFPEITTAPAYWLNKVGLPSASATTCEGEFVGAQRKCIFSNGLVFDERVAELEPNRLLTFDIVEQPRDPELLGHVDLRRGQFELRANGDGTTTLIGRSWYTLHVRPLWYFDRWTRGITRAVHLRVMRHIKNLSEARL